MECQLAREPLPIAAQVIVRMGIKPFHRSIIPIISVAYDFAIRSGLMMEFYQKVDETTPSCRSIGYEYKTTSCQAC